LPNSGSKSRQTQAPEEKPELNFGVAGDRMAGRICLNLDGGAAKKQNPAAPAAGGVGAKFTGADQ
jgi:hypothetical protein